MKWRGREKKKKKKKERGESQVAKIGVGKREELQRVLGIRWINGNISYIQLGGHRLGPRSWHWPIPCRVLVDPSKKKNIEIENPTMNLPLNLLLTSLKGK